VTDSRIRIGNNECLHRLERKEEDQEQEMLCLGWNLQNGADSFDSISRLLHILWVMQESAPSIARSRDFMGLTVHITRTTNGYGVGANFSEAVWELIESPFYMFEQIELPLINREIQCAFEEKVNKPVPGQYATIFEGRDGATLQILQPHGSGVWIAGSHKKAFEYQLTDHNTDTSLQALMHVIGLCTVRTHARRLRRGSISATSGRNSSRWRCVGSNGRPHRTSLSNAHDWRWLKSPHAQCSTCLALAMKWDKEDPIR
jgi:hypothetical protein